MIIVDCKSPLSQRILHRELLKEIFANDREQYIVTDRDDLKGQNIIDISNIEPPFDIDEIVSLIKNRKTTKDISLKQESFKSKKDCNCKDEVAKLKKDIFALVKESNSKLLESIEVLFEKR